MDYTTTPRNENSVIGVKNVLQFLADISGKKIITGQHTQTMDMEELQYINRITEKSPALLGFELLSYSPNINYLDTDKECIEEVEQNRGTLQRAMEWAAKGGLITMCWHWFSPLYGRSKSFFTRNTEFDASRAVIDGTPENRALISDMDVMAGMLRPFCDRGIPILWRPLHECEGDWFWWSAKGGEVVKMLYRMMYKRYTDYHKLNNLIWVWNGTLKECYPGDDVVDIITRDMYPSPHNHSDESEMYHGMTNITEDNKIIAIGETGVIIDIEKCVHNSIPWAYYMTWSKEFCLGEKHNSNQYLYKTYHSEYAVTLENLPKLY